MNVFYLTGDVIYTATHGCSLRVFGISENDKDVTIIVHDFHDWVDIRVPYHARSLNDKQLEDLCKTLISQLNAKIAKVVKKKRCDWGNDAYVKNAQSFVSFDEMEILDQKRLMHYRTEADTFIRLYVRVPMLLDIVQKALKAPLSYEDYESNQTVEGWISSQLAYDLWRVDSVQSKNCDDRNKSISFELYNGANMDFRLKCDQTMELRPCGWFRLSESMLSNTTSKRWSDHNDEYHIQYKRGLKFDEIDKPIPSHAIRCAGFDIECIGTNGQFPKAEENPIITISLCFHALSTMQISNNSKKELHINGGDVMIRYALQLGTVLGALDNNTIILNDSTPCEVFSADAPATTTCICFPYDEEDITSRNDAERELLLEFVRLYESYGPHVIVTYNGNAFDTPYILKRAGVLGIGSQVRKRLSWGSSAQQCVRQLVQQRWDKCEAFGLESVGRGMALAPDSLVCIEKEVTTTAFGTQIRRNVVIPGKVNFDLMCWWKLNVQESYYTLGGLSQKYVKRSKKDLPYHLLPFRFKTPEGRLEIVEYCVMDTVLTMYLASLKVAIIMFMSMSYVQMVDISQKFQSGQGYCALSMLIREINARVKAGGLPYAIPENATISEDVPEFQEEDDEDAEDDHSVIKSKGASDKVGYQGATVLDSVSGIYDDCIACCDFASLYPSIMMAHNLSYETHLEKIPDGWIGQSVQPDPRGFDGWELGDAKARTKPERFDYQIMRNGQRFVAKKHHVGLLASIVEKLIQARKAVRAQMKKETSDVVLVALEQRQLSIKYAANSVYGAAGARKGKLPSATFIAESVTNEGRAMIDTIKFVAENIYLCNGVEIRHNENIPIEERSSWFNMQVIYGDTVREGLVFPVFFVCC